MQNPRLIQLERGITPRKLKKERRLRIYIVIVSVVLAVICKFIHLGIF